MKFLRFFFLWEFVAITVAMFLSVDMPWVPLFLMSTAEQISRVSWVGYFLHLNILENRTLEYPKLGMVLRSYSTIPRYCVEYYDLTSLYPILG